MGRPEGHTIYQDHTDVLVRGRQASPENFSVGSLLYACTLDRRDN